MKDIHNSSLGLMLKLITPKGFKTWKAKSYNAIIAKTWEHGFANQCNISKLGMPSLEPKNDRFRKLVCQVLTIIFLCSCLGKTKS